MKLFRKIVFWCHLIAGVTAGVVILIMSVTGAILAFQPQIEAFAEREARFVRPPENNAQRLDPRTLLEKTQAAKSDLKFSGLTIHSDPTAAAAIAVGREGSLYVNPYTGEITGETSKSVHGFFQAVTDWHRWLAAAGEQRAAGRAITGACNLAFLVLAITGVYLWFPRRLTWQHLKPVTVFNWNLKGRARDFNWHNTIGFWSSLVLIVLTATAVVISYNWASNLLFYLTGNEPPAQQQGRQRPPNAESSDPHVSTIPENFGALWARAEQQSPEWRSINVRLPLPANAPATFTIDEGKAWNPFGRSQLTLDAKAGEVAKWEPYVEQNWGRKLRSWTRFTHTGETGGIIGQIIAFLGCVGGAVLVWTGFALAWRRLRSWMAKRSAQA